MGLIAVGQIFNFGIGVVPWWGWEYWIQRTVIIVFVSFLTIPVGAFLFWRGRQYAAQASAEPIITVSKAHVLYLRAFRSDPSIAGLTFSSFYKKRVTEEDQMAAVLQPFGDLIAIGRPGESLPTPGAARIYTSDDEWKDVVKRQIQAAQLVMIRAAPGENVFWELAQAVKILHPQKLLILLNMKLRDYESFRTRANSVLDVPLPESTRLRRYGRVSGFIGFAADWKPSFFALRAPYFRSGSFERRFKYALKPVFESFGLEWRAPPVYVQVLRTLSLLLSALIVLILLVLTDVLSIF